MAKVVCRAEHISKTFGSFRALDDVSIEMEEGQIYGLLGSNGAGKSTLTRIMSGLLSQDSGGVYYYDFRLEENYRELKKLFSVVPQEASFYQGFSVRANIEFFGIMYGMKGKALGERVEHLLDWLALRKFENRAANELSGGYKRLLNIACSLVNDPAIIFMDEPTVGLDPAIRKLLWEKVKELKHQNKTICLTTHYLDEAQALCDYIGVLVNGRLIVKGEPMDLIKKYGGYRILVMKVDLPLAEEDTNAIKNTFEGSQTTVMGNTIVISFHQEHSLENISLLTQWLMDRGYSVTSSIVREPELEDVFLNVTGDRIRGE
ncbi:putative branched-chain amino acid transport ATP-binding protein LivG [uncultured archaeon]|nr:putative branched-chain amino acid transport ATP-binding protein LivG [uncultured archaeon]